MQRQSTNKSNQLLKKWITLYCCSPSSSLDLTGQHNSSIKQNCSTKDIYNRQFQSGEASLLMKKIFHTVIRQNVDMSSVNGVKQAEYWLSNMYSLANAGCSNCAPDVDAHNLVLLGYCNLCKFFTSQRSNNVSRGDFNDEKDFVAQRGRLIVEGVERLVFQLANNSDEEGCRLNILSLNLSLNALAKIGRFFPDVICRKTNSLLFLLMGEEKFRNLVRVENDKFDIDTSDELLNSLEAVNEDAFTVESQKGRVSKGLNLEPNLDTYHWLVDIYSSGTDITHTMRSLSMLRKMNRIREKQDIDAWTSSDREPQNASASFAPSTGTHCKVLCSLLAMFDNWGDSGTIIKSSRADVAKEMTQFLDSMVLYRSSFPSPIIYLYLLRLWQKSCSPEAGQYAEEILSRMEVTGIYQNEWKVFSGAYLIALDCWLTSASAGRSGAAERAFR